ncbi:MAG: class I SAM-dependent methyltransferase [Planctomycetaceae bacterium]|jgi:SAM-dependent methyltransferase|nr:class I SAM-dependent methyltransferase [Phycisphaerales bacterium]MCE2652744.1 class I SAM-dependent methyltransferase [Planctomycetaceae bacterium]
MSNEQQNRAAFYGRIYNRLYRLGYHRGRDYSHAKELSKSAMAELKPTSMLDVGCSTGWTLEYFSQQGVQAVGVDISEVAVKSAQKLGRDARVASATDLPFGDRAFDLVLSTDCLEHMRPEDAPRAVAEMTRVAKRWIAVKINPRQDRNKWWKFLAGTHLHLTCVPVETWLGWFREHGFEVLRADEPREEYLLQRVAGA